MTTPRRQKVKQITPHDEQQMIKLDERQALIGSLGIKTTVFFGGSIEMGNAVDWQQNLKQQIESRESIFYTPVTIFNPRNEDWDTSIDPTDASNPVLYNQITWELHKQQIADLNVFYFAANTISPITLMELGLHKDDNTVVFIDDQYDRKANVQITCDYYDIPWYNEYDKFVNKVVGELYKISQRKM